MNFLDSELIFIPLGGSGEIGMNANLYHYQSDWLMIDLGISFSDETTPVSYTHLTLPTNDQV